MSLVSVNWLLSNLRDPNLRIVDTRFTIGKPEAGRAAYEASHIPGALFADLEHHLSLPVKPDRAGGRHPLPTPEQLASTLGLLGIANHHHVVAYDDPSTGNAFYASHLWWLLRYLGHDAVSVLDGGLPAWLASGGTVESEITNHPPAIFTAHARPEMLVDANYVKNRAQTTVLVDSRAPERFRGDVEPLDWKAGHIPGAINCNWADSLSQGQWKSADAQLTRFDDIKDASELILYCGSGVSATGNLLALELAGVKGAKLYAGSWSDWISNPERTIQTGE